MAANTILCLKLNSNAGRPSLVDSSLRKLSESSLLGYSINQKSWGSMISKRNTARTSSLSPRSYPISASYSFDVVIVGAGIIGLTIARQFLLESNLSVAVIDKAVPCSGATGAGTQKGRNCFNIFIFGEIILVFSSVHFGSITND